MKAKKCLMVATGLMCAGFVAWSMGLGQDGAKTDKALLPQSPAGTAPSPKPALPTPTHHSPLTTHQAGEKAPQRDLAGASLLDKQAYLSSQRGVDWLQRVNRPDGRFVFGYLPALRTAMEGDNFQTQVEAALALARAGRFFRDDKAVAVARQALLTLLLDTIVDPKAADVRYTNPPSILVNRLSAAGLLVVAIHELPAPGKDLLDQANQLGNFIRRQQRGDGSLMVMDAGGPEADSTTGPGPEGVSLHAGPALAALMRGHAGPAVAPASAWRIEAVRKAAGFYARCWSDKKNLGMIRWHTAAYAEAFRQSKEQAFADAVFAMNDWLCDRQHQELDPRHPLWLGGFKSWADGKDGTEPPDVSAAASLDSLVEACRTARQAGDVRRWQRYRQAAERSVQFLSTLQYTDANTQHFAEWYRPVLVGGLHRSHQDGNLRLEDTAQSVAALVSYLKLVSGEW